jgi:hypothetical protein
MTTAAPTAEGNPRAEATQTTWTNKRTLLNLLQVNPVQLDQIIASGKIRKRQIAGLRPQYALEDALALR